MDRRHFNKIIAGSAIGLTVLPGILKSTSMVKNNTNRFGGPVFDEYINPE
jgi:hypothetical protein